MKALRTIAALALVLAALIVTQRIAPVARAQSATAQVITTDSARLRSGPGTTFAQLATIPLGTELTAIGRNADASWVQVSYNGAIGWVSAGLLRITGGDLQSLPDTSGSQPPATQPPAAPPPAGSTPVPPPAAPPGSVTGMNYNTLNVRAGAGSTYKVLGTLPARSTVVFSGRWPISGTNWLRFDFNGQPGWAPSWAFKVTGVVSSLPDFKVQGDAAVAAIPQICVTGAGVPMAASYAPGPGIHPALLFDFAGAVHPLTSSVSTWKPPTTLQAELVGCIGPRQSVQIEYCPYEQGHSVYRYQYMQDLRLVAAQTGEVLGSTTLVGNPPRYCQDWETFYNGATTKSLYGDTLTDAQVIEWLTSWVKQ